MNDPGWWKLDTGDFPMDDADWEHIATQIRRGMIQGELFHEQDETDETTPTTENHDHDHHDHETTPAIDRG